jgi:drug/metabolite transporter (DMT)-like permease
VAKLKARRTDQAFDPDRGPILSVRFALALLLMVLGIAWIVYYYVGVRDPDGLGPQPATGPGFLRDLAGWNYLIGFGAVLLGLAAAAHPSTPLGRGRGVVIAMLACFLIGLIWICTFYVISDDPADFPVFNDLDQKNLFVGITFMAVGFTFATRWE